MSINEIKKHPEQLKSMLTRALTLPIFENIVNSCTSKVAQHLQLTNIISDNIDLFFESYMFEGRNIINSLIAVSEIRKMLNYKDVRSTMNWCKKNNVFVIQQGNSMSVNKTEFMVAFQKPFIEYLKYNYSNWKERFLDYVNSNYKNLLSNNQKVKQIRNSSGTYSPKTEAEKSFLKTIKKL